MGTASQPHAGIAKTQFDSAKEWLAMHNDAVMTEVRL
jgi:hypothetical protein